MSPTPPTAGNTRSIASPNSTSPTPRPYSPRCDPRKAVPPAATSGRSLHPAPGCSLPHPAPDRATPRRRRHRGVLDAVRIERRPPTRRGHRLSSSGQRGGRPSARGSGLCRSRTGEPARSAMAHLHQHRPVRPTPQTNPAGLRKPARRPTRWGIVGACPHMAHRSCRWGVEVVRSCGKQAVLRRSAPLTPCARGAYWSVRGSAMVVIAPPLGHPSAPCVNRLARISASASGLRHSR